MSTSQTPLSDRLARLEQEASAVRKVQETLATLRATFAAFPGLREDFAAELQLIAGPVLPEASQSPLTHQLNGGPIKPPVINLGGIPRLGSFSIGTNFQRIEAFLRSRNNEPATIEEIKKATGIPEPSIRHLFSTRFPGLFQKVETKGARLKRWKLKKDPEHTLLPEASAEDDDLANMVI